MDEKDFEIIEPPNRLEKLKSGEGAVASDDFLIQRAEDAIREFGKNFAKWGLEDIRAIDKSLERARKDPAKQEECIADIFRRAMDIKGQGGSFDYPLISQIGQSLKTFTENRADANPRDIEIIAAHIEAMRVVLTQDIRGDGGEIGKGIAAGLLKLTSQS